MGEKCLYKIVKNDKFGRYIAATTKIKQGQLILKEKPAILCPQLGGGTSCFNCSAQITSLHFCSECSAAILCNPKCKGQFHDLQECSILKITPIKREDFLANPDIITPLRCLLWRHFNKTLFDRLLQLEGHVELRRDDQVWNWIRDKIENVLFKLKCIDDEDIKAEIIQKICAVIDINTFDVRQPQKNRGALNMGENLRGLYFDAAMMAHDCLANAHLAIDDDFVLYVHAAVDISEGEPILFNYTNVLNGTDERRRQLKDGKYFECKCLRCEDPTEMGTEMSTLKCPRCYHGFIRPKSWQCSLCKRVYPESLIRMTLTECRRRIDDLASADMDSYEKFLKKLSLTFHPHHYLVLEAEQNLIKLYTRNSSSVKHLRRKIEMCNKFLEIFRKVEPGISRIQAVALYELHSAVISLAQKIYNNREVDGAEFIKMLFMAENTLKNSIKYLLYEPPKSPEGRLAQNALAELKMLRATIGNFQEEPKSEPKRERKQKKKKK